MPSWVRQKDEVLKNGRFFGHTEWGIKTEMFCTDDALPVIEQLSSLITTKPDTLKEVANECNAEWNILFSIDIRKAVCFQYRTGIGKILKKVLPDNLKTEYIRKEEELFGSMNFVEKVYNK